jgi:hypothetical protein
MDDSKTKKKEVYGLGADYLASLGCGRVINKSFVDTITELAGQRKRIIMGCARLVAGG